MVLTPDLCRAGAGDAAGETAGVAAGETAGETAGVAARETAGDAARVAAWAVPPAAALPRP
ncbi:hypothetical protein [Plantactinospora sp. KBS50]|uniref:hypothetical protein n=1 Tax=Plantactinospora sp. KBS50 TaxID=2024580 RepID=UPI0012FE7D72|nr:hypothetical protein [Plantactinospora sp. KBS50]